MMFYAVDLKTKKHRVTESTLRVGEIIVEADVDGWIKWGGGECPLPNGQHYQVKFALEELNGDDIRRIETVPELLDWEHRCGGGNVIAYRPILSEPEMPEWDGEGLPPVGCECELLRGKEWVPVEITGKGKRVTVFRRFCNHSLEEITETNATEFRPIRSEEERVVDELAMDILDTVNRDGIDFKHHEKKIAERLYDMGYRKVED